MNSNDRELAYMRFCENASGGIAERRDAFAAGWDAALAAKSAEQQTKPLHEREAPHCPSCSCGQSEGMTVGSTGAFHLTDAKVVKP